MLIEAAKGGHTNVVQLLLDYPHSMMLNQQGAATATNLSMLPGQVGSRDSPLPAGSLPPNMAQPINFLQSAPCISSTGELFAGLLDSFWTENGRIVKVKRNVSAF